MIIDMNNLMRDAFENRFHIRDHVICCLHAKQRITERLLFLSNLYRYSTKLPLPSGQEVDSPHLGLLCKYNQLGPDLCSSRHFPGSATTTVDQSCSQPKSDLKFWSFSL